MRNEDPVLMTEQRKAYADLLDVLVKIGLVLLVGTFAPYAFGILPPKIPLDEAPGLWALPLGEYLDRTGAKPGLGWLGMLRYADYLPLVGIAFLATAAIVCYLRIIPIFARKRNVAFLVIAVLQVLVLLFAASGILTSGG